MANPLPTTTHQTEPTSYNTVFIDTNLNTHLALIVSDYDTVLDLKNRIAAEHALCFPEIGKINVRALKVKRKGWFYHLSESMYVKSAFHGVKNCWFISVDASVVKDYIDNDRENKNCVVSVPVNVAVDHVGYVNDDSKRLLKGCNSLPLEGENDRKLDLGSDEGDGGGKHVYGTIGNVVSGKRKREEEGIEKDEVGGVDDEGEEGNLEDGIVNVVDRLLEGKAVESGFVKKRERRSKKKSRNAVEDLPVENTERECSEKRVELRQDEPMHEGNKNNSDEHSINGVSDANKRSDKLFESNDGPAGGSNEVHKTENEGQEGNLENNTGSRHGKVIEERARETGFDKNKKRKSKKKHRIAVEDLPLEKTIEKSSKIGAEIRNDDQMHKDNEGIANEDCINATSDASKRSDILSQKVDGQAGGSDEDKNKTFKDKAGDVKCEIGDASRLRPAAKKKEKRETKRDNENSVKKSRTLDTEYKKDELRHPTKMEPLTKEKNKNSARSPTKKMENPGIVLALPSFVKRKGKNKLSKSAKEETSRATDVKGDDSRVIKEIDSKDFDEESNAASVPGKHALRPPSDLYAGKVRLSDALQESNDKSSSQVINTSDIDSGNAEVRHNTSGRETSYSAMMVNSSKDDDAISAGRHPGVLTQEPNVRDEGTLASGDKIVTHNKEEREKSPSICNSAVLVEKSRLLAEEECSKSKDSESKLAEHSELRNGKKSSKKRKNAKKDEDLAYAEQLTSAREHAEVSLNGISLTEAPNYGDNSGSAVAKEESKMHLKKRIEMPEVDAGSTSVLATDQDINDVIQNVVESVNKITETFIETENVDGKLRKKSKKTRGSQKNNLPELETESRDVIHKNHSKEADSSSKMISGVNDSTVQDGTLPTRVNTVSFEKSELPPQKLKVDNKAKTGDEDDALRKVLIDKATDLEGANGGPKEAKKKKKKVNVHPSPEVKPLDPSVNENQNEIQKEKPQPGVISSKGLVTSLNEGPSSKSLAPSSNENQKGKRQPGGSSSKSLVPNSNQNQKKKPQPGHNSSNIELSSSFSNANDKPIKPSEVSGGGVRAVPSNKSDGPKSDPDEARKHDVIKLSLGGRSTIDKEAHTESLSSLGSSKNSKSQYKSAHRHQSDKKYNNAFDKKAMIGNSGDVVISSQHGNRLIEIPGATFKGDISRSSADEDNSDSSDATTRTPSNNSLSSDHSDGESSTDVSSSQSGSSSLKRKGGGGKNSSKHLSSGMTLDAILRSSSRYKKAKITASQSQLEDTESQAVDFVPESQPIS